MNRSELRAIESNLEAFLGYCFQGLGRVERRQALGHYVRGLMLDGERKSMEPVAQRLAPEGQVEAYRQRMQEAVSFVDWDQRVVFRRIAERAYALLPDIAAWVIDDTGFPKKGYKSVGVQRQYSGTLGRIDNCQTAPSLHLASEAGGVCIGMQLYLPKLWADDAKRRALTKVPDAIEFREKWKIAIDLIDDALSWDLPSRPVVADAGYGDVTEFRNALVQRGLDYIVGVSKTTVVWPPGTKFEVPSPGRRGRPRTRPLPLDGATPISIEQLAQLETVTFRRVTWREGTRGPQWSRFAFLRVQTAHKHTTGAAPGPEVTLIIEWPRRSKKPTTFYLSSMPPSTSHRHLVFLAKLRWRIEQDYQEMKGEFGLDHFEGRGWRGFHHHVACVATAYAFLALHRALFPPRGGTSDSPSVQADPAAGPNQDDRVLPAMPANTSSSEARTGVAHLIE
jgi:SRSO17 transposase